MYTLRKPRRVMCLTNYTGNTFCRLKKDICLDAENSKQLSSRPLVEGKYKLLMQPNGKQAGL